MPTDPNPFLTGIGLDSDIPKQTVDQDRLDVAPFVRRLVGPVLRAPVNESFVLGLYGPWGFGKSTALNFLEEELWNAALPELRRAAIAEGSEQAARLPSPLIVRFTPWLYGDVESLLASFFETLAATLHSELRDDTIRKGLAKSLRGISDFIVPAAQAGSYLTVGPAAGLISAVWGALGTLLGGAARLLKGGEVSYRQRKADAARLLHELGSNREPQRVVVLIDDLDRAAPAEMLAMLKLVKLVADLPNISYVIALDKDRVTAALTDALKTASGGDYLEKIIQIGVSLPPFPRDRLARMAVEEAKIAAADAGLDSMQLEVDWSTREVLRERSFAGHIRRVVSTPRDVTRLSNAYRFAMLSSETHPEVHPVDLLLLCSLQIRFPAVYQAIRENRRFFLREELTHLFAIASRQGHDRETARKERVARLSELLAAAGHEDAKTPEAMRFAARSAAQRAVHTGTVAATMEIVLELFPECVQPEAGDREMQRLRSEARIASPNHFDGYFRLDPPTEFLRSSEIDAVFGEVTDASFDGERAQALTTKAAALSADLRDSLRQAVGDRARTLTAAQAAAMLHSLPILAEARAPESTGDNDGTGCFPWEAIGTLLLRAASESRSTADAAKRTAVVSSIIAVLDALPDDESAELANDFSHRPPRSLDLSDEEAQRIAAAGLPRAEALVRSRFAVPAAVRRDGQQFSHDLWRWRRLADISGAATADGPYSPVKSFVDELLARDPLVIAEVLALAAGWGGEPYMPGFSMRTPAERHETLLRVTEPIELIRIAELVMNSGQVQATTWPYLLADFVDPAREWLAELARREEAQRSPQH